MLFRLVLFLFKHIKNFIRFMQIVMKRSLCFCLSRLKFNPIRRTYILISLWTTSFCVLVRTKCEIIQSCCCGRTWVFTLDFRYIPFPSQSSAGVMKPHCSNLTTSLLSRESSFLFLITAVVLSLWQAESRVRISASWKQKGNWHGIQQDTQSAH